MFCWRCGQEMGESDAFCEACGAKLARGEMQRERDGPRLLRERRRREYWAQHKYHFLFFALLVGSGLIAMLLGILQAL